MKKQLLGGLVWMGLWAIIFPLCAGAVDITQLQARQAVQNWLRRTPAPMNARMGNSVLATRTIFNADGESLFHVVQLDGGGFVVTSADDEIVPVIAFSEGNDLLEDARSHLWIMLNHDMPERLQNVHLAQRLRKSTAASAEPTEEQRQWAELLNPPDISFTGLKSLSDVRVAPFVQCKWGQGTLWKTSPSTARYVFNYYTPNNSVCGCGATALAQVMRHHRYPASSVSATFTCKVNGVSTPLTTKGGSYNWAGMPLAPAANTVTDAECQAISKITYDAGVAIRSEYTPNATTSYNTYLYKGFRGTFSFATVMAYFGNGPNATLMRRAFLPNLDAKMPVMIGITGAPGGHFVLADGYGFEGTNLYLHLNMGWRGTDDAWYNLPHVDTDNNGTFSTIHTLLYNVFPTNTGEIVSGRVLDSSGAPIAGAMVMASNSVLTSASTVTDSNGIYALFVPSGTYTLLAGDATQRVTVSSSKTSNISADGGYYPPQQAVGNAWGIDLMPTQWIPGPPITVPAEWFAAYGLSGDNFSLAVVDSDGDGRKNWEEYVAGTNPTNSNDYLRTHITSAGSSTPRVTYSPTNTARIGDYAIQGVPDMLATNWGATNAATRFYRAIIRVNP